MIDEQTSSGKVPYGVSVIADANGVPMVGIYGGIRNHEMIRRIPILGSMPVFSLAGAKGPMTLQEAMDPNTAQKLIQEQAANVMRLYACALAKGKPSRPAPRV